MGKNQKPGSNKEIVWDVLSERDHLKGDIIIKIEAAQTTKTYKSSFLPVFVPGARMNYYPGGPTNGAIKAFVFYGLIGSSVYFKLASNKQYDLYHKATTQEEMDAYYKKADANYQMFQGVLYTAACIWALDMLYRGVRGFRPVNNRVALGYDAGNNTVYLTYVHKF